MLCQSGDTAALAALDGPYLEEESLTLAPVVTGMEKILCIGLNYRAHAAECGIPLPENPTVFCKLPNALAAHGQAIALPAAEEIDYEAELVLVRQRPLRARVAARVGPVALRQDV